MEEWRVILYPLGFISALAFSGRFLIQWLQSERAHQSVVPFSFWRLSLTGNLLLFLHSLIQIQVNVAIVQALNAVISWRNLNLMQTKKAPLPFYGVLGMLFFSLIFTCSAFALQHSLFHLDEGWLRTPSAPWQKGSHDPVSINWHIIGFLGYFLFSSRFWIQWWSAEKKLKSLLPLSFWWLSLSGALLSIGYFIRIGDTVNLIGPLVGIIPYIRNLMLIKESSS